eukprot:CAMPEP_0173357200 /NCGR_PEP_ID=MMETSP1144-20121109/18733_1 /TAXON_ID=483371 /ORGANISM="non described non described, Strain CCMP2298" /LENGTH=90 /DNA_ID=CAMNT_0014306083 /DNA_START=17 /DNA_END=290 /DNA_ORIENTATION=-
MSTNYALQLSADGAYTEKKNPQKDDENVVADICTSACAIPILDANLCRFVDDSYVWLADGAGGGGGDHGAGGGCSLLAPVVGEGRSVGAH